MKKIILIVISLILGACGTVTREQAATAYYGSYPTNYENIVKQHFEIQLIDPTSVIYRSMTTPRKWYFGGHGLVPAKFGYVVCVSMNAKNSFGGYTGLTSRSLLIRDGEVIAQDDPNKYGPAYGC